MRAIRRVRPDVLFTWDPFAPYENHQDHRAVAWAAMEAASFSHFPLYHPEHRDAGLEPHYVGEQYFFAKAPRDANKAVDISAYVDRKIEALCQHVSQMEMTVAGLQVDLAASRWTSLPPGWKSPPSTTPTPRTTGRWSRR
jgi:LmbE family N-acetylglucosaminyl deacetylase